jgi:ABC-type amino acid transport/signal transduction systems, periplasmic component/domain
MKNNNNSSHSNTCFKNIFLLAFFLPLVLISCGDKDEGDATAKALTLVMGTSADMPPFEFYKTGEGQTHISGFDIDVARAIAQELNHELKIKDMDFSGLIPALQAGRVDFVMASMTPTPERLRNVAFSEPYLVLPVAAVSLNPQDINSQNDFRGKKIGVQLGSTHEQFARSLAEKDRSIKIVSMNKLGELIQELVLSRIDVVIMETKTAKAFQKKNADLRVNAIEDHIVQFAIAFPKNSPWIEKVNEVIKKLHARGSLEEIKSVWFSDARNNS